MENVDFVEKRLLENTNFLTTCFVMEALEHEELLCTLRAYSDLDLSWRVHFQQLITGRYLDDMTLLKLFELTPEEKRELLNRLNLNLQKNSLPWGYSFLFQL